MPPGRSRDRKFYVDFSDVAVAVYFLTETGVWSHEHINPMFLEFNDHPFLSGDERAGIAVYCLPDDCGDQDTFVRKEKIVSR